jgi:hypothetical protein
MVESAQRTASVRIRPTAVALEEPGDETRDFLPEDPADLLIADPARRSGVSFRSGGVMLAGHLYRPPGVEESERRPLRQRGRRTRHSRLDQHIARE